MSKGHRIASTIIRILLGLGFVVFGLNCFLMFIPQPKPGTLSPGAESFDAALMATGYMMQLIGATQLLSGLMLLFNRFVPLALLLLAPFFVNSFLFHAKLEHMGLPMSVIFILLWLYLVFIYRKAYTAVLTARFDPAAGSV